MFLIDDNHRLHPVDENSPSVRHVTSPNTSGNHITHRFLVMHYTAGSTAAEAVNWFQNPDSKVSAHITLDRDGSITQSLPFNIVGWHVGASYHKGYSGLNSYSIGIEIVNYGKSPDRKARVGAKFKREDQLEAGNWMWDEGTKMYWERYTEKQFEVLDFLTPLLIDTYNLREVVGHEEVATPAGRKPDPGRAFPIEHFRQYAEFGNAQTEGAYIVIADGGLKLRGGPGTDFAQLQLIPKGSKVKLLTTQGDWALIQIGQDRGFVYSKFLMRV